MSGQGAQRAEEWLKLEDISNYPDRLARLTWMVDQMPDVELVVFRGGLHSKLVFEEARYSYLYGQFISTVILGLSFVEQTLAALFYSYGRVDLRRAGVAELLREAVETGWLSKDEYGHLNRARQVRNSLTHFRPPLNAERIEYRAFVAEQVRDPDKVLERDARRTLEAIFSLFGTGLLSSGT